MRSRTPSRLALALLARFVADNEPLTGDLIEEFDERQSQWWLWRQVIGAVICQRNLRSLQPRQGTDMLVLGAAVLVLLSFEAVFVTNLMRRLTFGPPLPNISGNFYLLQRGLLDAPAGDAVRPAAWMYPILVAVAIAMPFGWLMARFHERHYAASLVVFTLSIMVCAGLNLQSSFAAQFATTSLFIVGLLAGGAGAAGKLVRW